MYTKPNEIKKYRLNYKEAKFHINEKVIIARITPGDEAAAAHLNYVGKVVGHFLPYALVQISNDIYPILERDLERYLG